jgi:hypothetical protein
MNRFNSIEKIGNTITGAIKKTGDFVVNRFNDLGETLKTQVPTQEKVSESQSPITKKVLGDIVPGVQSFIEGGVPKYVSDMKEANSNFEKTQQEYNKNAELLKSQGLSTSDIRKKIGHSPMEKKLESLAMGFLNPESGMVSKGSNLLKELAKEKAPAVVETVLTKLGIRAEKIPTLAKTIANTTKEANVSKLLKEAGVNFTKVSEPLFKGTVANAPKPKGQLFKKTNKEVQSIIDSSADVHANIPGNVADKFEDIVKKEKTPISKKVGMLDYARTPKYVLDKIGLGKNYEELRTGYNNYLKELPENLSKVTKWSKEVSKESNERIFNFLDGGKIQLNNNEQKVANEIKVYLSEWADKLKMPKDSRISEYITHLFPIGKQGEIDEEIARLISNKVPGSVYDPFLLQRKGAEGYLKDTWQALDAYIKRATRKVNMDSALGNLKKESQSLEQSMLDYVTKLGERINLRPTKIDTMLDNDIKRVVGYAFGSRPVNTITRTARKIVSRAKLGLNFSSGLKNITQGINTFSELGPTYTARGYLDLFTHGGKELKDAGVLLDSFIEDRSSNAVKKFWENFDKVLFANFQASEYINRGAAYYGAKAKALSRGMTEEAAKKYGTEVAAKTQFKFDALETPLALSSDIAKTIGQFQTFTVKQLEFLGEKVKGSVTGKEKIKNIAALARYIASSYIVFGTIGKSLGMDWTDMLPSLRFGTPPAIDLPTRLFKDVAGSKDQYGNTPTVPARVRDVGSAFLTDVVPGGSQIKKTVEGISTVKKGKSTTASGNWQYKVSKTPSNYIKGALFGKTGLPETQKYYENKNKKSKKTEKKNRFNPI